MKTKEAKIIIISTLIFWLTSILGWYQAFALLNESGDYYSKFVNLPSIWFTLFFTPLPFFIIQINKYLTTYQKTISTIVVVLIDFFAIAFHGIIFLLFLSFAIFGGGLDIMLPENMSAIFGASIEALPIGLGISFLTIISLIIVLLSDLKQKFHVFWISIPIIFITLIIFFKILFLIWGM